MLATTAVLVVATLWRTTGTAAKERFDLFKRGDLSRALGKYTLLGQPWPRGVQDEILPYYKGLVSRSGQRNDDQQLAEILGQIDRRLDGRVSEQAWASQNVADGIPHVVPAYSWEKQCFDSSRQPYAIQRILPLQLIDGGLRNRIAGQLNLQDSMLTQRMPQEIFSGSGVYQFAPSVQQMQPLMLSPYGDSKDLAEAQLADSLAYQTIQQALRQPSSINNPGELLQKHGETSTSEGIVNINDLLTDPSVRMSKLRPDAPCLHVNLGVPSVIHRSHMTAFKNQLTAPPLELLPLDLRGPFPPGEGNTSVNDAYRGQDGESLFPILNAEAMEQSSYYQGSDTSGYSILSAIKKGRKLIPDSLRKELEISAVSAENITNGVDTSTNKAKELLESSLKELKKVIEASKEFKEAIPEDMKAYAGLKEEATTSSAKEKKKKEGHQHKVHHQTESTVHQQSGYNSVSGEDLKKAIELSKELKEAATQGEIKAFMALKDDVTTSSSKEKNKKGHQHKPHQTEDTVHQQPSGQELKKTIEASKEPKEAALGEKAYAVLKEEVTTSSAKEKKKKEGHQHKVHQIEQAVHQQASGYNPGLELKKAIELSKELKEATQGDIKSYAGLKEEVTTSSAKEKKKKEGHQHKQHQTEDSAHQPPSGYNSALGQGIKSVGSMKAITARYNLSGAAWHTVQHDVEDISTEPSHSSMILQAQGTQGPDTEASDTSIQKETGSQSAFKVPMASNGEILSSPENQDAQINSASKKFVKGTKQPESKMPLRSFEITSNGTEVNQGGLFGFHISEQGSKVPQKGTQGTGHENAYQISRITSKDTASQGSKTPFQEPQNPFQGPQIPFQGFQTPFQGPQIPGVQENSGSLYRQSMLPSHPIAEKNFRIYQNVREAAEKANQRALHNGKISSESLPAEALAEDIRNENDPTNWNKAVQNGLNIGYPEADRQRTKLGKDGMPSPRKYLYQYVDDSPVAKNRCQRTPHKKHSHSATKQHH